MFKEQDISNGVKKINSKLIIKIFPLLTIISIIIILILTFIFLYKNFYQTITHAQKIKVLKSEISIVKIDMNLYKNIISNLEKKKKMNLENLPELKDPFQSVE